MTFNINDIKSKVNGMQGLQVPNLCQVKFNPRGKQPTWAKNNESLSLLGYAFAIPALNLVTTQVRRQGFGVSEQRAVNYAPSTISLEFFLDNNNTVLDFFNQWALRHVNYQVGAENSVTEIDGQETLFGQVGYQEDYAMDLDIEIYSPMSESETITTYKIRDAAIINLGNIELGWQQNNEITTLTVQLSYRSFIPESNPVPQGTAGGKGLNLFQFITKMKGAVEVVKSFEKPSNVQDALNLINNAKTLGSGFD